MTRLSICIPTFRRPDCLAHLLDSIVAQGRPDIEVVISDDASGDDTAAVAERYRGAIPKLIFVAQPQNIGLDKNFQAVVALASGDYAWLMGDDDQLEPGAVDAVLSALDRWPGVAGLTLGSIDYDYDFADVVGYGALPETQRLEGAEALFTAIPEALGFMSTMVVNAEMWGRVCAEDPIEKFQNLYVQVYIAGRMAERFGGWGVVNTPCVGYRTSNDQFLSQLGWVDRLKVDVVAYEQLADAFFGAKPAARRTMRTRIFNSHIIARLRNAKTAPGPTPKIGAALALLLRTYADLPAFWYSALPTLLLPGAALREAKRLYQRYSPTSGAYQARRLRETADA